MARETTSVADVVAAFRRHFGGPAPRLTLPAALLDFGALCGDAAARLGWSPPVRSTALAEMRRGVAGDPAPWIARIGVEPKSLDQALAAAPATVQERWFARLFLLKAAILATLALFWFASGLVGLTAGAEQARALLASRGFGEDFAALFVAATSLLDCAVGAAITVRKTSRAGLAGSLAVAAAYLVAVTIIAPDLWLDPLGPLLKVAPAMLLALTALGIADDR